jgi:glutathione S-transferase
MKLYVTNTSPYARIVRIVVWEKNLETRIETIVARTRVADSPYYRINPSGRVPYLVRDDGVGLEDSALICSYLDHLDGEPAFEPPAGEAGWEVRRLEALARSWLDAIAVWTRELRRPAGERSATTIAHEEDRSQRLADTWEVEIAGPLMQGPLTMAQIVIVSVCQYSLNADFCWRHGRPNLAAWVDRIAERVSIAATALPSK